MMIIMVVMVLTTTKIMILRVVSKMSRVMNCRDGGRNCFIMVMVMMITMILMAMMILDVVSE